MVMGGGPAGSTVASLLARRGHSVIVIEKERFPRFHIGESLLPYNVPLFKRLGVWQQLLDAGFQRKFGARFIFENAGSETRLDFKRSLDRKLPMSLQVRRAELDTILLNNARQAGADVLEECSINRVLFDGERATGARLSLSDGSHRDLSARMVIDASGRSTVLGSQLGTKQRDPELRQASLYTHFEGAELGLGPEGGDILIAGGAYGWFWMIPLDQHTTSVGVVFPSRVLSEAKRNVSADTALLDGERQQMVFDALVAASPEVSWRLAGAHRVRPISAAADFSYRCERFVGDGWMMVGDAAGFLDPVFSSGVLIATRMAEKAADALDPLLRRPIPPSREDLAAYEDFALRGLDRFRSYILAFYDDASAHLFGSRPPLGLRRAVNSAFAGKVFERDPRVWLMEKMFFWSTRRLRRQHARGQLSLASAPARE